MSLTEYKRKRDFRKTPEPGSRKSAAKNGNSFVIQKHDASRLHFDVRLELDGVLKSWAIPKGPSLDPAVKALAVQVEDHPLDYANFEGIIPKGQYGGGTVMVWDRGIWEPLEDTRKGLRKGKIKFRLQGEKLHGVWSLVRMHGAASEDGKNWLLIKNDDEHADADSDDPLADAQQSVLSGRSLEQIAADKDAVWDSKDSAKKKEATRKIANGKMSQNAQSLSAEQVAQLPAARPGRLPRSLHPQLATLQESVPQGENWLHELKFDGYRILAFRDGNDVRLITRNGHDWTHRFPRIQQALAKLPIEQAVLDGEVVALDNEGVSDFQRLQNILKNGERNGVVMYVFDLPFALGSDLTRTPLVERKQALQQLLSSANPENNGTLRYSDHIQGDGGAVIEQACQLKMEGIICKRADGPYHPGRSRNWLKVKCQQRQEFVIGGFTKPGGSRKGFGALLLGYYEGDDLIFCGRVGTGFNFTSLKQIHKELLPLTTQKPPFKNPPTGAQARDVTWVQPRLVGEVEFREWTDDGALRHPAFQGLREDKPAQQVVRESTQGNNLHVEQMENKKGKSKTASMSSSAKASIPGSRKQNAEVAGVPLTNPDRVLFDSIGLTKQQLAQFYVEIADWILPHIVDRPLTLFRCPQGRSKSCFYQKHWSHQMPDAVQGVEIQEKHGTATYVVIKDLRGLISLVQIGVLEFHPWPARDDALEKPDRLVFDLDPDPGSSWQQVVDAARLVHDRLSELGLQSYLRTSGGKGLHVVVPLTRRNNWDELKEFAKALAQHIAAEHPKDYVAVMSKAKRKGKVFIDYLRNQRGATAVATYSTRSRKNAPLATPLDWQELTNDLRPDQYNVGNLIERLKSLKQDPWKEFFEQRQSITKRALDI